MSDVPRDALIEALLGGVGMSPRCELLALEGQAVGLAGQQPFQEGAYRGLRLGAHELVHGPAVPKAQHRGDAPHAVALGELGSLVHVHLG